MMSQNPGVGFGRVMFIMVAAVVILGGAMALVRVEAQAPAPTASVNRLSVLFLGDEAGHRPYERAKTILPVLAANGIDMFYTDRAEDLNPAELSKYHSLIFYNNQPTLSRDQLGALTSFIEKGGGLVVLHCASAAFQNSEEYIKLVGGAFKSHGLTSFTTIRMAGNHPALQNVPSFTSEDETYVHTKHNPVDRTVLEVRRDGAHDEPYTWVRPYGKGRT
jgi:type 1 glutamine amidotransferase